ncbi:hypothetical protein JB92DRAFT_2932662, partial [Gautieria morchelliformis]
QGCLTFCPLAVFSGTRGCRDARRAVSRDGRPQRCLSCYITSYSEVHDRMVSLGRSCAMDGRTRDDDRCGLLPLLVACAGSTHTTERRTLIVPHVNLALA